MNKKLAGMMLADALTFKQSCDSSLVKIENGQLGGYHRLASFDDLPESEGVTYRRFNSRVERWLGYERTDVVHTKVTTSEWEILVSEAWWQARVILENGLQSLINSKVRGRAALEREIEIDIYDWNSSVFEKDGATLIFNDPTESCRYEWGEAAIQRWEGQYRTHIFAVRLTQKEWLGLAKSIFYRVEAQTAAEAKEREQLAAAQTFDEYVRILSLDASDYYRHELREAFAALAKFKAENHSAVEILAERERLGLVT